LIKQEYLQFHVLFGYKSGGLNAYISWTGNDDAESLHEQFGVRFRLVESEIVAWRAQTSCMHPSRPSFRPWAKRKLIRTFRHCPALR
jgi:hypothetical protein